MKTITSMLTFKIMRLPLGELIKREARLCAHDGKQQCGVNHWEICAPEANWASVLLLLDLSHACGLESKSTDYILASSQTVLETEVCVEIPHIFDRVHDGESHVLKLLDPFMPRSKVTTISTRN